MRFTGNNVRLRNLNFNKCTAENLKVIQRKIERSVFGAILRDHLRNEDQSRRSGVNDVISVVPNSNETGRIVSHGYKMNNGQNDCVNGNG